MQAEFAHTQLTILSLLQTNFPLFIWLFSTDIWEENPKMFHCAVFVLQKLSRVIILKVPAYIWSTPFISILRYTWNTGLYFTNSHSFYCLHQINGIGFGQRQNLIGDMETSTCVFGEGKHEPHWLLWISFSHYWFVLCPVQQTLGS